MISPASAASATPLWDSNVVELRQQIDGAGVVDLRVPGQSGPSRKSVDHQNSQVLARREVGALELIWLGGRDSNPDTVVQSHVSYRWTTSQSGIPRRAETRSIS